VWQAQCWNKKLMNYNRKISPKIEDIQQIESLTSLHLDDEFQKFYMEYSGIILEDCEHYLNVLYQTEDAPDINMKEAFSNFSSLDDIKRLWEFTGPKFIQDYIEHFEHPTTVVEPEVLLPFAESETGVFYISTKGNTKGKILHADNGDFGIGYVTENMQSFIKKLKTKEA
tara:strand:- start:1005 stop:1514 length:510 start_codon:yes stop_codon:yes gene_type:complete